MDSNFDKYDFLDPPPPPGEQQESGEITTGKPGKKYLWLGLGAAGVALLLLAGIFWGRLLAGPRTGTGAVKKVVAEKSRSGEGAARTPSQQMPLPAETTGKTLNSRPALTLLAALRVPIPDLGKITVPDGKPLESQAPPEEPESIDDLVETIKRAKETPAPSPTPAQTPSGAELRSLRGSPLGIELEMEKLNLVLSEIQIGDNSSTATINGKQVVQGRDYGSFRVLEIMPDKVRVQYPGELPVELQLSASAEEGSE